MKGSASTSFRNLAGWDRASRFVAGLAMLGLGAAGAGSPLASLALLIFGWVPLVTAVAGWCPFYALLGVRTWWPPAGRSPRGRQGP